MTRTLVTMALPYANGSLHLGHMVEGVQTDVYVRALRAMGNEVIFLCAADQHGTPIEVNARKAGMEPEAYAEQFYEAHKADYKAFGVDHDLFYRTHSPENRLHVDRFYHALEARGAIDKRDVEQFYCEVDKRFLPDRFVKGSCPKCGTPDQYGDACEKCGSTYEPTDLKDPKCALCGTPPIRRTSKHYFVQLSKFQSYLQRWTAAPGRLQPEVKNSVDGWLSEPLKDWDISREAPYFGFNIPGEDAKYFYVWLDAPIGYISTADHLLKDRLREWWPLQPFDELDTRSGVDIVHFIGKDIVYHHTLFWPAMLNASGDQRPAHVHVHGMLGIEGEKMSKSRGTFINARQYLDAGLDSEWLRYFYASNLGPSPTDIDLSFGELKNRVNGELLNNVGNLANRSLSLLARDHESRAGAAPADAHESVLKAQTEAEAIIRAAYLACDTRSVVQQVLSLATQANARLQRAQPWKLVATDRAAAQAELTVAINSARVCAAFLGPIVPGFKHGVEAQSGKKLEWYPSKNWLEAGHKIGVPGPLIRQVKDEDIRKLTDTFAPREAAAVAVQPQAASRKPQAEETPPPPINIDQFGAVDLRAGKIVAAEKVPKKDKLLKLTVDLGEPAPRTIASGVAQSYAPDELIGKIVCVVANLPPRDFGKGLVSHGMVLYSSGGKREHTAVELPADVVPGAKVK